MRNPRFIDHTGQKFGSWLVIRESGHYRKSAVPWECVCQDCGTVRDVAGGSLRSGKSKGCGCLNRFALSDMYKTHGQSKTRLYNIWQLMKYRCSDLSNKDYGAKGIKVCEEWQKFEPFYEWAKDNGYEENLTIDRKKNHLGYFPDNCRWATPQEQSDNRSIVRMINGIPAYKVAEERGIPVSIFRYRMSHGWSMDRALNTPIGGYRHKPRKRGEDGRFLSRE